MRRKQRVVLDTNVLVSRAILPGSVAGRVTSLVFREEILLLSDAARSELADVLGRPKFSRYVSIEDRQEFLRMVNRVAEPVVVIDVVRACRDPRDDKFLELASNGLADVIVSGDHDLLALHPFRGIPVLSPAAFLGLQAGVGG